MKYSFLIGLALGFLGLLGAAGAYPWVQHPRLASRTAVVPNGGRAERFVIRLPADRIEGFAAAADGAVAVARPGLVERLSIEQFKIRDVDGRVIGIAARHRLATPEGATIAWTVSIPSRGTLMLAGAALPEVLLEGALARDGYVEGTAWEGDLELETVALDAGAATQRSRGTGEFTGLDVGFSESWSVTGVDADGALRGTIELETVGRRTQ